MNDSMAATKNCVVHFHYRMHDDQGDLIERSGDEPEAALLGHQNLMPGLEAAMEGREAGDAFEVTLAPDEAFGPRREDWTQRVSKKYLRNAARLQAGAVTNIETDSGPRPVTVLKVGGKFVDVDLNHPVAGRRVSFKIEVTGVRAATEEEIAHRHVHGAGGHHH
jgi:FKBP-type peptidyl-prolyl cis-trans isomerase SlyD